MSLITNAHFLSEPHLSLQRSRQWHGRSAEHLVLLETLAAPQTIRIDVALQRQLFGIAYACNVNHMRCIIRIAGHKLFGDA